MCDLLGLLPRQTGPKIGRTGASAQPWGWDRQVSSFMRNYRRGAP
jgi:hypothetical protein